jgi:hypothetical protein
LVNRLLTITIKVNIVPTAESQLLEQGHDHEEDHAYGGLLELASWKRLVRRRIERLTELP